MIVLMRAESALPHIILLLLRLGLLIIIVAP
jgi:hypothetical protein